MDLIVVAVVVSVWSSVAMWPVTKGGVVSMSLRMHDEGDVGCLQACPPPPRLSVNCSPYDLRKVVVDLVCEIWLLCSLWPDDLGW